MALQKSNNSGFLPSLGLTVADNFMNNAFANISNSINAGRNFKMWQAMNKYNAPINQVARLKQAGLNPNLAYTGTGAANAGNAGSAPSAGNQAGYVSPLNKFLDKISNLANLKSILIENANKEKQGKGIDIENALKEQELNQRKEVNPLQINEYELKLEEMRMRNQAQGIANDIAEDSKEFDKMLRKYAGMNAAKTWDNLEEDWKYKINQVAMQVQQFENLKKQYDVMAAQEKDYLASAKFKASSTYLNYKIAKIKDVEYDILQKAGVPEAELRGLVAGINKSTTEYAKENGYFNEERDYEYYQNRLKGEQSNAERTYMPYGYFIRALGDALGIAAPIRQMLRPTPSSSTSIYNSTSNSYNGPNTWDITSNKYYGGQPIGR